MLVSGEGFLLGLQMVTLSLHPATAFPLCGREVSAVSSQWEDSCYIGWLAKHILEGRTVLSLE